MPEMVDVASHFDDIETKDAYTGQTLFMAQFNTHDESSIDGSTERKRSMSVRPGTLIPARRAITIFGETWIVGDGNTDGLANVALRKAYWLKRADEIAQVFTPKQLLQGSEGRFLHINKTFLKDVVNGDTDSQYDPFWEIFVGRDEQVLTGYYYLSGGELFRVRTQHKEISGFRSTSCDQLEMGIVNIKVGQGVYDPVTETTVGGQVEMPAITLDAYKLYNYSSALVPKIKEGDLMLVTATPLDVGTQVEHPQLGTYRVNAVRAENDAYANHVTKS